MNHGWLRKWLLDLYIELHRTQTYAHSGLNSEHCTSAHSFPLMVGSIAITIVFWSLKSENYHRDTGSLTRVPILVVYVVVL